MWRRITGGAALVLGVAAFLLAAELTLRSRYRHRVLADAAGPGDEVTLVALGDSIVAGTPGSATVAWPALLAGRLQAAYPQVAWRVVNAGQPGDTAPQGYLRFEAALAGTRPRAVLIAFGLNDCHPARYGMDRWFELEIPTGLGEYSYLWRAIQVRIRRWGRSIGWLPQPQPERGRVPLPRTSAQGFAAALTALVRRSRELGARPVLLTMTPLANAQAADMRAWQESCLLYNAIIRDQAARWRVPLVELATGLPAQGLGPDGVHLTPAGQDWVAAQVYRQLAESGFWARLIAEGKG
jgi:lysophospholipase L1-like esterase